TDGKEDVRGIKDPVPILSNVTLAGDTFIHFVSMGEHEPQLDEFARATPKTRVLKAPTPEAIREVAEKIRTIITAPKPVTKPAVISITPKTLDFTQLELGATSAEKELTITSDKPATVAVRVEAPAGLTVAPIGTASVAPGKPATIRIRVDAADDAVPGAKQIAISAGNATALGSVQLVERPLLARLAKWLVALALLAGIAAVLWFRRKAQNRLEGELEIVQPPVAPDAAFVGLPTLKTDAVALSGIVPPDILGGSDARLFVRRSRGEKKVVISAQGGSLRVNDIETPSSELYDADLIEIGTAKLRFNRAGYMRASSTGEEL
ncbi:MAG: hypothetical protein M3Q69_02555, partial [Acidobacteriota bacterium]|nr:hypothetical protein [Acidobacteriota bacterium]